MKLIVGLGNPEQQYVDTRHNAGFMLIDAFARNHDATWQEKTRFKALVAETNINGDKLLLIKPTTYYNNSGEAVRAIVDFYNIESADILILHDDIDLPFGTICTRVGSSPAGNNGLKSIRQHIGDDTSRVRIGTKNEVSETIDASDFVLSRFPKDEQAIFNQDITPAALHYINTFLGGYFAPTKCSVIKSPEIDSPLI